MTIPSIDHPAGFHLAPSRTPAANQPGGTGTQARSYLFVPGHRPERFDKAWSSAADAIILDLEDAVPPEQKDAARAAVRHWLHAQRPVWVRCNAADTPWFAQDLALAGCAGLIGLMLPKAEQIPAAVLDLVRVRQLRLIPLIETARGMASCTALAQTAGVVRLAFGAIDFQADLNIEDDDEGLLSFRSQLVLASRLAGLPAPVDGVTVAVEDDVVIRADTQRARRLGFGARLCIHPRQVDTVHLALAPTAAQLDWARRVVSAMEQSGGQAVAVDGKMIDRPVLLRAQQLLAAPAPHECLRV